MLLNVELALADYVPGYDKGVIIEQMLQRNDLPGGQTTAALTAKADLLAGQGRLDEAEGIVDRILAIEEHWAARFIKWHICMVRGKEDEAARHLEAARRAMPETVFKMSLVQAWLALGRKEEAMETLSSFGTDGLRFIREQDGAIGELARSAEFAAYCAGRTQ
jgi:hypothetical protein